MKTENANNSKGLSVRFACSLTKTLDRRRPASRLWPEGHPAIDELDASEAYEEYEVSYEPIWGDDTELVEQWFTRGEELKDDWIDWVDWVDLYKGDVDRSDLIVHWVRCLLNPNLSRPRLDHG
jgi:hypothetical protein